MAIKRRPSFNPKSFLAKVGEGRSIGTYHKDQIVFSQGDPADAVFYIQRGKAKVTVLSEQGKEAVVAILGSNDFFGEGCLAGQTKRIATVATMMDSIIVRLEKAAIVRVIHQEPAFSEMFIAHLLGRTIRVEADLVDQLFNSSEGIAKAKAEGKYRGGIPTARAKAEQVFALVDAGKTRGEAAEVLGISIRSVFRILRTRKDAETVVTRIPARPQVSA